ncbi:tetratricopeptide repeat protein [Ornithinibacillus sp. JPR2-1]|uniref:tetratricopeptide repeat protein n=1 Tax=Ornithinibacillus sp. JPR2-1 TaxID=2094019 RepID=UPI0031CEDFB2
MCYNNIHKWDESIRTYHHAKKILTYLPEEEHEHYLGMIYNNLGNCYETQEDYHQAIKYYLKSLKYKRKVSKENNKMITYINLVRCYYKLDQWTEAINWLEYAFKHCSKQTDKLYVYQIRIFQSVLFHVPTMEEIIALQNETVEYFKEQKRWSLVIYYGELFAQMYEQANHHKKANQMYKQIMRSQECIRLGS